MAQVLDTEKRLNILFDHLNNSTLLQPDTVMSMQELAVALRNRDYDTALALQLDLHTNKVEQCGQWMVSFPCCRCESPSLLLFASLLH
jgi:protein transport protein SEC31